MLQMYTMKFNCLTGAKSRLKVIINSSCFTKKKATFHVHINKDESDEFIKGLKEYLRQWEENN
jgi:hypothetical protein